MQSNNTETVYYIYHRDGRIGGRNVYSNPLIAYIHGSEIEELIEFRR